MLVNKCHKTINVISQLILLKIASMFSANKASKEQVKSSTGCVLYWALAAVLALSFSFVAFDLR